MVLLDDDGQTVLYTNLKWVNHKENCNNPLTRKHISENAAMLEKFGAEHPKSVSIVQLSKDGQFIRRWGAAREVERELGINNSCITRCCRGRYYRRTISDIKPLF